MLSANELKLKLKYVRDTGHFPGGMTGKEIGQLLDFSNQSVERANQKIFDNKITARNKYFVKLFLWSLEHGQKPYKSNQILVSKDYKKEGDN